MQRHPFGFVPVYVALLESAVDGTVTTGRIGLLIGSSSLPTRPGEQPGTRTPANGSRAESSLGLLEDVCTLVRLLLRTPLVHPSVPDQHESSSLAALLDHPSDATGFWPACNVAPGRIGRSMRL
jgi:hypothetical protein